MKYIVQIVIRAVAGLAVAAMVLGILLPAAIQGGYLEVGSPGTAWIIGGVIAACVLVGVLRPRRRSSRSGSQH